MSVRVGDKFVIEVTEVDNKNLLVEFNNEFCLSKFLVENIMALDQKNCFKCKHSVVDNVYGSTHCTMKDGIKVNGDDTCERWEDEQ